MNVKKTIYVLNTQGYDYQNLKRHPQYSKWFKYYCIRAHSGMQFEHIQFGENAHGKPILNSPKETHINVSHTDGCSVCVVSDTNVGVDVEKIETIDLDIAKKYFALLEYRYINDAQSSISRFNRFFEVWTMKECYLKLLGIGMYKALDSFSITPVQGRYQLVETEDEMMHRCSFFHDIVYGKYALSVILDIDNHDLDVELLDITKNFNTEFIL